MDRRASEREIFGGKMVRMWMWSAVPLISMQVPSMLRMIPLMYLWSSSSMALVMSGLRCLVLKTMW